MATKPAVRRRGARIATNSPTGRASSDPGVLHNAGLPHFRDAPLHDLTFLHQIDPSLEEASINLGVPPALTFLRITVPLMLGGIVGGLVLTFVTVASELSATVVLYSGPWTTMTVAMFQALEGTSAGIAAAAATVLIICTVLPVALVYRLLRRHELSML